MIEVEKEKIIAEAEKKIAIYEKLLTISEFQYFLKDIDKIIASLLADSRGILGSYKNPGSGCLNMEIYREILGHLHGLERVKNLPQDSIIQAKINLKDVER